MTVVGEGMLKRGVSTGGCDFCHVILRVLTLSEIGGFVHDICGNRSA